MSSVRKNRCGNAIESIQAMYKCLRDEVEQIEKVYMACEKTERDLMQLHRDITYVLAEIHIAQKITGSLFEGLFYALCTQASELQDDFEKRLLLQVKEMEDELGFRTERKKTCPKKQ
ncbi:MAG: hypothetical protein WC102_06690 [Saccharofermentanales bacterium]